MNVKPGILARIVVSKYPENRQAIVSVEHACTCYSRGEGWWICRTMQNVVGDVPMPGFVGSVTVRIPPGAMVHLHDRALRPLHDGDGEDETLRIVGKPNETPVDVINEVRA